MGMLNAIKLGLSSEARERMQSDVSGMSDIISVWTEDDRNAGGKHFTAAAPAMHHNDRMLSLAGVFVIKFLAVA